MRRPFFEGLSNESIAELHNYAKGYLCRQFLIDPEEAGDLVQELFLTLYRRGHFDAPEGYEAVRRKAFVTRSARNLMINRLRKRTLDEVELHENCHTFRGPDPSHNLHLEDCLRMAEGALAGMNPDYREAYILREAMEFDYREIARQLDVPVGTVMSRIYRARRWIEENVRRVA